MKCPTAPSAATFTIAAIILGLLSTLLEKIDYDKLREEQKQARANGKLMGIGIVIGVEPGGRNAARDMAIFPEMNEPPGSGGVNGAKIKLEKNGSLSLHLGSPNCGQAHETTTSQVAAEILGSTPDKISTSIPFDSDLSAWGVAAANSGNNFHLYDIGAIHGAATRLQRKNSQARSLQLPKLSRRSYHPRQRRKGARAAAKQFTFAELGRIAYNNQHLIPDDMEAGLESTCLLHVSPRQTEYRSRPRSVSAGSVYLFRRRPRRRRRSRQGHRDGPCPTLSHRGR